MFNPAPHIFIPSRDDVASLKVGDLAIDPFGTMRRVVEIRSRAEDVYGRLFVCFSVERGGNASITQSYKEGRIVRGVSTSFAYTSAELDRIEEEHNNA